MSTDLAAPVRRSRTGVVLVIAIVSIAATAAAWTLLSPADAAPKPQGVPGYEVVQGASFQVAALGNESADVACPVGKKVLGGGASGVDSLNESFMFLRASAPLNDGSGWHVRVGADPPTGTVTVIPWAVCATA